MTHQHVHDFLRTHPMGVLSTVSEDGRPWGAAVYYVPDEDFNFYFVTRKNTHKYKNIEDNPFVAFTVADADDQVSVQAAGKLSKVPPEDYMDVVFTRIARIRPAGQYNWAPPVEKVHQGDYMALCLTPDSLRYADFKKPEVNLQTQTIQTIIPAQ